MADGSDRSDRRDRLSGAKRELLARRLEKARRQRAEATTIPPRGTEGPAPLSFSQERLWFIDQLEDLGSAYTIPGGMEVRGELDLAALERAVGELIARHETLRTSFGVEGEEPRQTAGPARGVTLEPIDLGHLEPGDREEVARQRAEEELARPIDLATGPLFRFHVLRLDERRHWLVWAFHHIVSDAWSLGVFARDLAALYNASRRGEPSPLPALPVQYSDFAVWQRRELSGERLERELEFWRGHLAGAPTVLQLPTDRPRGALQSFAGAKEYRPLGQRLVDGARALAREEGVTPFMTLLAAFTLLLGRMTGQEDVVVGSPISGRQLPETEPLIGFLVNNLVLRTDLSGAPSFRELLGRVRRTALDAYSHPDLPFEKLVQELDVAREMSHPPLFQVLFSYQHAPLGEPRFDGLEIEALELDNRGAMFDLAVFLWEAERGLVAVVEYNTDLFDRTTVRRFLGWYENLLSAALADPDREAARLPMLAAAEERALLAEAGAEPRDYPRHRRLDELVAERARRHPERVAVVCSEESLTYGDLLARADALARRLAALGVGPEVFVGLCLERSLQMVVAVLAVLRAGGAYIPLDPAFPSDRLALMVEDAGAGIVLTHAEHERAAPRGRGVRRVAIDRPEELAAVGEAEVRSADAEGLAYLIYTSGSTGRPKGVQIPHRTVANFLASMRREPGLDDSDTLLSVTTLSFDISVLELFLPLTTGARLVLARREEAADGEALAALLERHDVTCLQATPTTWRLLLEAGWEGDPGLVALCGGEAMARDLAETLLPRCRALWNMYGPTETTIWSAVERVESGAGPVPVGPAIDNTTLYVLDPGLQPVPPGVAGELFIGGEGLARGYWRRPGLTADRFLPDPFAAGAGARLYRTGDLVRARGGGRYEFLGRIDHQIKIRGFRVELGEIETALAAHPAVGQAVVIVREDRPGDERLVAYVIPHDGSAPGIAEVRELLRDRLPDYMVPSAVVELDRFPQTPNGKIDRRSLPAPGVGRAEGEGEYVAPRTPVEERVAQVWGDLLGVDRVGARDDFFELGGHSLLATKAVSRLRRAFGVELPLRRLFESPTVEGLAAELERAARPAGRRPAGDEDREVLEL